MSTTGFITQLLKSATPEAALRGLLALCLCVLTGLAGQAAQATEVSQMKIERSDDGVYLSVNVTFDLPFVVEDALLKGIPMFFVAEADIYRGRWYWYDKRVTTATRTLRLAYQPLTRRWRLHVLSGAISVTGLRASLSQSYDSLPEAISSIQRLSRWRIADASEVEPDVRHNIDFRFRLDLTQLPRPFQIGVAGQREWAISTDTNRELLAERLREPAREPVPPAMDPAKEAAK